MSHMLSIQSNRIYRAVISIISIQLSISLYAPCFAEGDQYYKVISKEDYAYSFKYPIGLSLKDRYNGEMIEFFLNEKLMLRITVFKPNPEGMVATDRGMTKSDDLSLKERITIALYDVCKPQGMSPSEFEQTIDWSFPIISGEVAVQANSTSCEKCSFLKFPSAMMEKDDLRFWFSNKGLQKEEFDKILSSFMLTN